MRLNLRLALRSDRARSLTLARALLLAASSVAVPACTTAALPGVPTDGGPPAAGDLATPAGDLAMDSCDFVRAQVMDWLDAHSACGTDSDCQLLVSPCGLPAQCGNSVNTDAEGAYLTALYDRWHNLGCPAPCTPCPAPFGTPGCIGGTCGFRGHGMIGDACHANAECHSNFCLDQGGSKLFLGGYCTLVCDGGVPCPMGSDCKPGGDGKQYCLKRCDPQLNVDQCRAPMGYGCCSGPGPQGMVGWCAPTNSPLCLAR